jgi:hypothetical protein
MKTASVAVTSKMSVAERRWEVSKRYLAAWPIDLIAKDLSTHPGVIVDDIRVILNQWRTHQATAYIEFVIVMRQRLDALLSAHWEKAMAGDIRATEVCQNLMVQQLKLVNPQFPGGVDPQVANRDVIKPLTPAQVQKLSALSTEELKTLRELVLKVDEDAA